MTGAISITTGRDSNGLLVIRKEKAPKTPGLFFLGSTMARGWLTVF